jgi:hypothetical protein
MTPAAGPGTPSPTIGKTRPQTPLTVREAAQMLNVSECYVRRHQRELGVLPLPGVVRFDRAHVEALTSARSCSEQSNVDPPNNGGASTRTRPRRLGTGADKRRSLVPKRRGDDG